jgi:peptidoglycan/xylan/chitin deacetylase (PgdA/CDA1 family)
MYVNLRKIATNIGWRIPAPAGAGARGTVTLVYHGVPQSGKNVAINGKVFESQIRFLREHFDLITPDELNRTRPADEKTRILLTFDDGFRNNAEVVAPILGKYSAPAVFFVATRHLVPGRWLWFAYLRALENGFRGDRIMFRGRAFDMSRERRAASVASLREALLALLPHPAAMYGAIEQELPGIEEFTTPGEREDQFDGMSAAQVNSLSSDPLFTIGAHTADHPMLTRCTAEESRRQIEVGRAELERVTGKPCDWFAYPSDDHNADVRRLCSDLRFDAAFSVHRTFAGDRQMTIPRVGVYYPAVSELGMKVQWNGLLRRIRRCQTNENN